MARLPALATSLAVHAAAFAVVVLIPILGTEPLPEPGSPPLPIPEWPISQRVVLADTRRVAAPPRPRAPSANPTLPNPSAPPPVANTIDPVGDPIDPSAGICVLCAPDDHPDPNVGTGSGPTSEPQPGGDDESGGSRIFRVGGQIRPPTKLRHVNPEYPELAHRAGIRGEVVLECLIDATGRITDVRVLSGHALLAPAAVNAVSQWLYRPTELNGVAVPVLLTVTVHFNAGR